MPRKKVIKLFTLAIIDKWRGVGDPKITSSHSLYDLNNFRFNFMIQLACVYVTPRKIRKGYD